MKLGLKNQLFFMFFYKFKNVLKNTLDAPSLYAYTDSCIVKAIKDLPDVFICKSSCPSLITLDHRFNRSFNFCVASTSTYIG